MKSKPQFTRDHNTKGIISIEHKNTENQWADIFIKSTDASKYIKMSKDIGLVD